ncbi:MAG: mechanosensitive ion channel [Chitinophagales bacterium]|nr:mechanosensitive ion channel [Chitinophagaceae bacterium]MCB9065670.1 mechanosensitive ion channel [Chitinophagales bacterium]
MKYLEEVKMMTLKYAPSVAGALITLIIGFWLSGFLARRVRKILTKREVDESLVPFLSSMVGVGIKVLVLLSAASMFGIQVTSFVAIFSAMAFAIGLALQGNLSHLAAGVVILIFKYYKVGDFITVGGQSGTVKEIQIFNTLLVTVDNHLVIIPNGSILSGSIENFSAFDTRQLVMTFGIGYDDDIDAAKALLRKIAEENTSVLNDKDITIFVGELADNSVNFGFRVWVKSEDYWPTMREITETVKKEFDKAGIGIPFPQMDIHLHKKGDA